MVVFFVLETRSMPGKGHKENDSSTPPAGESMSFMEQRQDNTGSFKIKQHHIVGYVVLFLG